MLNKLFSIFSESAKSFEGQETGEKVIMILRRHPFTIAIRLSLLALLAIVPIIVWPEFGGEIAARGFAELFWFGSSIWYMALWMLIFYALTMYALNTVIVTDKRIIENEQHGFFHREVSELHMYRVQDVSVKTHGVIETFLSFGDVAVQTAASETHFVFHKIPNPEEVKDKIMKVVLAHRSDLKLS
jgi:membrane protein YdbS with pleckstrin-like domain